jgi:hypothetical protein
MLGDIYPFNRSELERDSDRNIKSKVEKIELHARRNVLTDCQSRLK